MKKHIIIAGVPRAGKSTISQMISKKFGYQHISMDSIIAGIEKTFPETGIDSDADTEPSDNLVNISAKMAPFIRAMMDSGEYDELDYGMVIDIYQLLPKDYVQYIDSSICDIYYFITSEVTAQERYEILKAHDTPNDYTYYLSDTENMENCISLVKVSKLIKEQCLRFDLSNFETANNRDDVINTFIKSLRE
ncbi:hypothetical protein [Clostridium sp. C8-1-8]|uniref:hypothetical protein n=1 Tax=Clostridium sp. C8-1-8 TaxID=2698831 RepID=UPI00136DAE6A|nr:hypothetical protein [Clostridium sp. C8-1-8]